MLAWVERSAITFMLLAAVLWPLEKLWPAREGQRWLRPALATDTLFYFGQALLFGPATVLALSAIHGWLDGVVAFDVRDGVRAQPLWVQAIEVVILADLSVYWFHRASHHVDFLWRLHRVHHTAEHLDWVAAHREHPLDGLLTQLAVNAPAMALGFPLEVLLPLTIFRGLWAVYIHSNARLPIGFLRYLLGSPELHHWHHAKHPGRIANYANLAPWCDLLFGTFHLPKDEREAWELGVPEPTRKTWWGQIGEPFIFWRVTKRQALEDAQ